MVAVRLAGMIPSAIEKEILIEAPVEVVWHLITEPDQIRRWFADKAEIELRVGGKGALAFKSQDSYQLQVEAVEPPRRFAFRWVRRPGLILLNDNSLLVEFILEPENGSTRLRVVESGFEAIDWSDEEKAKYAEDHTNGWQHRLGLLRDLARTRPAARE
jgi:uncharacterized protein YndB with AHSA1/START domain